MTEHATDRPGTTPVTVDVHIGTEKTGSTAIQQYLARNADTLNSAADILIPTSLGRGSSTHLAAACQLSEKPDSLRRMRNLESPEALEHYYRKLQDNLLQEIQEQRPTRIVLSCENFSSRLKTEKEIARLREFLAPFASTIRILLYLRDQRSMIVSSHTTKIRNGFEGRFNYPPEGRERPDAHYDLLLDRWAGVFGEGNLTVRLYEKERLVNGDVVDDFCATLGIPGDLDRNTTRPNTSPDAGTLELMRRINAHVPQLVEGRANPLRRDLMNALSQLEILPGTSSTPGLSKEFQGRFEAGNSEVAKRWFADDSTVPDTLFAQPEDNPPVAQPNQLEEEDLVLACAHLWNHAQREILSLEVENQCLQAEVLLAQNHWQRALELCQRLCKQHPDEQRPRKLLAAAQALAEKATDPSTVSRKPSE